jgi:hypothetical protein
MTSIPLQALHLPKILFGSELHTQKEWRKVARRAWKLGEWTSVLAKLEMVSAVNVDALIVTSSPRLRTAHPDSWRMYVVGEGYKKVALDAVPLGPKEMDKFDDLLLDGMKRLWFTVGLSQEGGGRFNLSHFSRSRQRTEVLLDYVDRFAYWLPELINLQDVFYDDLRLTQEIRNSQCPWAYSIVRLAADCGLNLPIEANWSGDVLMESLIQTRLIEPFEGRYRARRSRPEP